ncbi:hypothetical protein CRG98_034897, partial [Punica granatum]
MLSNPKVAIGSTQSKTRGLGRFGGEVSTQSECWERPSPIRHEEAEKAGDALGPSPARQILEADQMGELMGQDPKGKDGKGPSNGDRLMEVQDTPDSGRAEKQAGQSLERRKANMGARGSDLIFKEVGDSMERQISYGDSEVNKEVTLRRSNRVFSLPKHLKDFIVHTACYKTPSPYSFTPSNSSGPAHIALSIVSLSPSHRQQSQVAAISDLHSVPCSPPPLHTAQLKVNE